ncbi:MAG: hypothetical protein C0440_03705 [Candidatus Pelagibacter sp.]|nr:hypothetical protein [Candidatus Pelagibacter sp.]
MACFSELVTLLVIRYFFAKTMRHLSSFIFLTILFFMGCSSFRQSSHVHQKNISKEDMKILSTPPLQQTADEKNIQKKASLKYIEEQKNKIDSRFLTKISLVIDDSVPLKSVIESISKKANLQITVDSSVNTKITFRAINQSIIDIIERICELGHLRFEIDKGWIKIQSDSPYAHTYSVHFLNLTRQSQHHLSVATNIFNNNESSSQVVPNSGIATASGQTSSTSNSSGSNGSDSTLNVSHSNDFWSELEANLNIIVQKNFSKKKDKSSDSYFSIHKQGGLLTVWGDSKTHKRVSEYLYYLQKVSSSQVLIEAKIIEVTLNNQFRSGINWSKITSRGGYSMNAMFGNKAKAGIGSNSSIDDTNLVSLGASSGTNFSSILEILEEFGNTRTLSSPRLTVMNNQAAVLKVAQNQVYFRLNYDRQSTQFSSNYNVSSSIQTVPIGLIMSVQPSIDVDSGDVVLFLRPTISKFTKTVSDPAVGIATQDAEKTNSSNSSSSSSSATPVSNIPVVEVREIDSVMKLKDGEIGILGGLMEVSSFDDKRGIPGLMDTPILSDVFSGQAQGDRIVELVILLKVTIHEDSVKPQAADTRIQKEYISDPRSWSS